MISCDDGRYIEVFESVTVFLTTPKVHYIMEMGEKDPSKEA